MERKFNYADLSQVSKKTVDRNKRIESQREKFLEQYHAKLKEEVAAAEKLKQDQILSNARFSQTSPYIKNKERTKIAEQTIRYADRVSTAAMTDILSTLVEKSLLLDESEYLKLNPDYKSHIRETVKSFLESGNLETDIRDKRTLLIMEHVAKSIPEAKTGIYLKEEDIIDMVRKSTPAQINSAIDSLSGNIKERVANIVVKEQDEAREIEGDVKEVEQAAGKPEEAQAGGVPGLPPEIVEALAQVGIQPTPDGQFVDQEGNPVPPEAVEQILMQMSGQGAPGQEGGAPEGAPVGPDGQPMPGPEMGMDPAAAGGMPPMGPEAPGLGYAPGQATPEFSQGAVTGQTQVVPQTANKNTAVEVAPDGTVKINIARESFYQEVPRQGILESLALNEAKDMLKEGKEYNGDLALANALLHLTILEAFNTTGLFNLSEIDYRKMLNIPLKKKVLKETELGSAAAEPVATSDAAAKEETPSVTNKDVFPADEHKQTEEVKEVIVQESSGYKEKFKALLKKYGVKSPADLKGEQKSKFFKEADAMHISKEEMALMEEEVPAAPAVKEELVFGIPEEKKFPLNSKEEVLAAIRGFGSVAPQHEEKLAKAIIKQAKKFDVDLKIVPKTSKLFKYLPQEVSVEEKKEEQPKSWKEKAVNALKK
jgi:hypothetical protein